MNKAFGALAATSLFILLLLAVHGLHMRQLEVDVLFYAALLDGAIAVGLGGGLLFLLRPFAALGTFEKLQLLMIWVLGAYAFAISIPTVIDRSLSFYLLEKLEQRGGAIRQDAFERIFTQEYVREHRLVEIRLTEQLQSGTISIDGGCVRLTSKGKAVAEFGRFYRQHFLPRKRLIMKRYTDDLTDPFRRSVQWSDYRCSWL